jgi:chorismate mutase
MSTSVRAIRGATTLEHDNPDHLTQRVAELVGALFQQNELSKDDAISLIVTATPDIRSKFPAAAAREWGLEDVPLLGAQELDVDGATPRCIRLMLHVETSKTREQIRHVFLHDAATLRKDLVK